MCGALMYRIRYFLWLKSFSKEGSVSRLLVDLLRHTLDFLSCQVHLWKPLLRCWIGLFLRVEVVFERAFRIGIACWSVASYPLFFKLPGPSLKTLVALLHRPIFEGWSRFRERVTYKIACWSIASYPRFFKLTGISLKTLVALLHWPIFEGWSRFREMVPYQDCLLICCVIPLIF